MSDITYENFSKLYEQAYEIVHQESSKCSLCGGELVKIFWTEDEPTKWEYLQGHLEIEDEIFLNSVCISCWLNRQERIDKHLRRMENDNG